MALSLVVGPAHAGKVALLLERYLDALERDPWLIVPNRADVERVERDLLLRRPALLAGRIGTFDDLFAHVAAGDPGTLELATDAQRALVVRRAIAGAELNGLSASAGSAGFSDVLLSALGELESALRRSRARARATSDGSRSRTGTSSRGSISGIATGCAGGPPSGCGATSTPGATSPCSRTASRT